MTQQEKTILQGMYAAGFRYVVRDKKWILFGTDKFIKVDREWDVVNPETNRVNIKHYTAEEYQFSEEPYEFLLSLSDFQRSACLNIMADNAKRDCKITNFKTMYREYCKDRKHKTVEVSTNNNVTNFDD